MKKLLILCSGIFVVSLASFSENADDNGSSATLKVRLTDDPADYDAVNIDIKRIEINSNGQWAMDRA
jgi:hypothetical protein